MYNIVTVLDAVYVDAKEEEAFVAVKPKPAFGPILAVATTQEESDVTLIKELPNQADPEASCLWWRRGRVELPRKHGLAIYLIYMLNQA